MATTTLEKVKTQIRVQQQKSTAELKIIYEETLISHYTADLTKPSYNHRVIVDSRLEILIRSLKEHGFLGGIFVNPHTMMVIDGWHRLEQWAALGHTSIPCYQISCTPKQERLLHLSLNQQATTFNVQELGLDFDDDELLDYGFTEADLLPLAAEIGPPQRLQKPKLKIEGMTKLMAMVTTDTLARLNVIKQDQHLHTLGEVVEFLAARV